MEKFLTEEKNLKPKNLKLLFLIAGFFTLIILISASTSAQSVSYCCEKTVDGAWCQDTTGDRCATGFEKSPSSCAVTSYCSLGTCIDNTAGGCRPNVPQSVCNGAGGLWDERSQEDIPQCQLGCCVLGDTATLSTQKECKTFSGLYGITTNYRTDIKDQFQCLATATSEVKGACVFEQDFEKTCRFVTKKECMEMQADFSDSNVEFFEDYLCTAEELGTNCAPDLRATTCVEGKDEVYFKDTCGNIANIYDSSKISDAEYWSRIKTQTESCNPNSANADSTTCGNCNYYINPGSTCSAAKRGETAVPRYGNYICKDLSCEYDNDDDGDKETYAHGERWCADVPGVSEITAGETPATNPADENLPGSGYTRLSCYNGEVIPEPCDSFRDQVCVQSEVNNVRTALCTKNEGKECTMQNSKKDCENTEQRACKWIRSDWHPQWDKDNARIFKDKDTGEYGTCVPLFPLGFDFWGKDQKLQKEAEDICNIGNAKCVVKYTEDLGDKIFGGTDVERNEECAPEGDGFTIDEVKEMARRGFVFESFPSSFQKWVNDRNNMCISLGDCGAKTNYEGTDGYYSIQDLVTIGEMVDVDG